MVPMNEMHKYLRNGLLYFYNIATDHYEQLTFLRYYTEDMVFVTELLIQTYYLFIRKSTYGENFYGFIRSGLSTSNIQKMGKQINHVSRFSKRLILISLFFETILPYLKSKFTKYLNEKSNESKLHKIMLKIIKVLDKIA